MCAIPLMAWLCGMSGGGKGRNKQRPMSRLSTLIGSPSSLGETVQFRGSARAGHLPHQIFQKPAHTSNALLPFSQHPDDGAAARPPYTGGTGLELVIWSVAILDAQARSCFEIEHELIKAIKTIVPPTISVDCTVTVTHTLTSSRVKIVDTLLPWSYSLVIKDHIRSTYPVYAEDHEPLMPEEFLTTTLTSSLRGGGGGGCDDEWLAILPPGHRHHHLEDLSTTIKSFLEALHSKKEAKILPAFLNEEEHSAFLLCAPSTVSGTAEVCVADLFEAGDGSGEGGD
ncbi:hypothetical protein AC579_6119 [Pseudocercospora musae]|uniref:Uncharacterized protein n=1 Tax=Pseudocercospora musae TaxID=113226 RepID=A0A139ILK1_9PEZI|nr:hypothetical protein AC579_6119 [Pseudocercospora musae]